MKKTILFTVLTVMTINVMAQQKIVQTAGRTQLGEFAPEFAHLPPAGGEKERNHPHRDLRDYHSHCFLCRMAKSMGSVSSGQRGLGGRRGCGG